MKPVQLATIAAVAAIITTSLIPLVKRVATSWGALDLPADRKSHSVATPRLGGLAFFLGIVLALGAALLFQGSAVRAATSWNPLGVLGFATGATLMFLVGLIDDFRGCTPVTKLCFQLLAAGLVVASGSRISAVVVGGQLIAFGAFAAPLTVLWIVAITNAVNFVDGLDGLAAGLAGLAFLAILWTTSAEHPTVATLSALFLGACLGFLPWNLYPASIFMGDSGSLFLGFSLSVLSTYAGAKTTTGVVVLLTPVLLLGIPILDLVWAVLRRARRVERWRGWRAFGKGVVQLITADREHLHHRLARSRLGSRNAVLLLYILQAAACAVAIHLLGRAAPA